MIAPFLDTVKDFPLEYEGETPPFIQKISRMKIDWENSPRGIMTRRIDSHDSQDTLSIFMSDGDPGIYRMEGKALIFCAGQGGNNVISDVVLCFFEVDGIYRLVGKIQLSLFDMNRRINRNAAYVARRIVDKLGRGPKTLSNILRTVQAASAWNALKYTN